MKINILPVRPGKLHVITVTLRVLSLANRTLNRNLPLLLGNRSEDGAKDLTGARPHHSYNDRPRVRKIINDNYCAHLVAGQVSPVCVTGKIDCLVIGAARNLNCVPVTGKDCYPVTGYSETRTHLPVYYHVANLVPFADGSPQERCKSRSSSTNKICERCFLCRSIVFCKMCHKCPNCCSKSTCRNQIAPVLGKMGSPRRQPQSSNNPQRRLHPTLLVPAKLDQVTKHHKLLCKSPQEPLPVGGIASAYDQKCSGTGNKSNISGLLQAVVFGPQTQQPVETYPRPEQLEQIFKNTIIQNGDPRDNKDLPANRGMGDLNRFQGCILPYTYTEPVKEVHAFSYTGQILPIQSSTHPQSAKCYSGQAIQTGANHSNGMVPPSRGLQNDMLQVAPAPSGPVCHQVQQQAAPLCLTGPSPPSLGSGCPQSALGGSGPVCLPTSSHLGQSGGEIARLPVQQIHSDCTRVTQHALVLGSGDHVVSDPTLPAQQTRLTDSTIQPDLPQESGESEPTCLAPIATAIKEQGFSEAVAGRIEAPQRGSTRSVYEAEWTIFTKWCLSNQVDFRAPPIKSIADFLLYLFQDRKLQPSTIAGKLGNSSVNVSKDENVTRLLDSFHRDRPRSFCLLQERF